VPSWTDRLTAARIAGVVVSLFGAWVVWQAFLLPERVTSVAIGPRVFPVVVGLGIMASGVAMALARGPDAADRPLIDWHTLGALAGVLAAYLILFVPIGFPISSTLFLVGAARILGSRSLPRDLVAGVGVSVIAYIVFTRLLGLELPGGPFGAF
jgi:putative tricarboxylic transport membrane protein